MGKMLALTVVALLAVLAVQAIVAADGVVVVNPTSGEAKTIVVGERGQAAEQPGGAWVKTGAYVPAVPTPPGVIGQYGQLPCSTPNNGRQGGWGTEYLVRELGENAKR